MKVYYANARMQNNAILLGRTCFETPEEAALSAKIDNREYPTIKFIPVEVHVPEADHEPA